MSTIKSSAENLTLNADGANNDIKFQSNGSEVASIDQAGVLAAGGASIDGAVTINESGADVDFRVESDNDANALFVQGSDGNVGIGISTPTNPLTVEGDGARIAFSNTATYPCLGGISGFRGGTTHGNIYIETAGGSNFNTPVERIAIEGTTGEVKISTGDLFFGTAGKGIVLGATTNVDANTLDDYEEGTWTPSVLTGSGVSIGTVYANSYIKIGKVCTLSASFQVNSSNSPSAYDIRFGGFPFSFAAFDNGGYPISLMYSHNVTPTLFMSRGGYVYYQGTTVGGNNAEPFGSALLNGSNYLSLAFSYHTT